MDQKELLKKMKALRSVIEDYIDNIDMSEADEDKPEKNCDKKED
jgi:hypothetical protein